MTRMRRPRATFTRSLVSLILLAVLAAAPGVVLAQGGSGAIPANARAKSYGSGWECKRGYREVDGACAAVKVPANAYPTNKSYGRGWTCERGYREVDGACTAIKVPSHAYLDSFGDRWNCERGYRKVDEACLAVKVPAHAYYVESSYGLGWKCDRGYHVVDDACAVVAVPKHAHLDNSGNDWECTRPYEKKQNYRTGQSWCALP